MNLAKAKTIGRKRRRLGQLWPMPIRETDLGHIYTEATVRPLAGAAKSWTGRMLAGTRATDGRPAGATLVFAGENEEPLLGVTVLESTGFYLDPQRERLIPRLPKRKRER